MMKTPNVGWMIHEFRTPKIQAVTISQRVVISPSVVDAHIVQATTEAARWYGLPDALSLIGRWQSFLQHPDDIRLSRAMAIRRHFGYGGIPTDYVLRIRVGNSETYRTVMKRTKQIEFEEETYWITILEEPHEPLLVETFDLEQFPVPDSTEVRQYSGIISVAEMEARLHGAPAPDAFFKLTDGAMHHKIPHESDALHPGTHHTGTPSGTCLEHSEEEKTWPTLTLQPGTTVCVSDSAMLFLHRCAYCRGMWLSAQQEPARCPRLRADTRGPKCGTRQWRQSSVAT